MFLRFTKKFSRPKLGFTIALLMLFAPALIATTVESAQKNKAKATPTPKKKATPTPKKNTQAKTKPTPKPTPSKNAKTSDKNKSSSSKNTKTTDKNKTNSSKKNEKPTTAKTNQKTTDKNKASKTGNTKNSKQALTANNKIPSKNTKTTDKNKTTSSKNTKSTTPDKNKTKPSTPKTTTTKTTPKTTTPSKTTEIVNNELPQVIVTTFSVPIKSQAKADAATLSNVKLGTVLRVTEKNPAWYKVQYSSGGKTTTGWISANSTSDLNASGKTEIYHQIVERNYTTQMDFESAAEIYDFLSKVDGELDASDKSAELELKRLLVLRSALRTIPPDKRETSPYKDFIKSQEKEIVYNEPAGQWLVASNRFWDLHNKYKKSTVSDRIAWEAANNPLPGECEGYVNCYLFDMRMRFGEYLNLHPNGKNAAEALKNITDYLSPIVADLPQKKIYNGPNDVTDRAEFNNLIAELRTILARLPFVEKEKTLQQLRQIAEAYR